MPSDSLITFFRPGEDLPQMLRAAEQTTHPVNEDALSVDVATNALCHGLCEKRTFVFFHCSPHIFDAEPIVSAQCH